MLIGQGNPKKARLVPLDHLARALIAGEGKQINPEIGWKADRVAGPAIRAHAAQDAVGLGGPC